MGSRMAANLMKSGHQVVVWNRSVAATKPLVEAGARLATSPRDAAIDAEFVVAMLRDDQASREVWLDPVSGAFAGMSSNAVAIDSSTLSVDAVKNLASAAIAKNHKFIEAPVSGSRPQAEAGQLVYLVGGDESAYEQAEPILKAMGASSHYTGGIGTAALTKLSVNALLGIQAVAMAEILAMLDRAGADRSRILEVIAATPMCSPFAKRTAESMIAGNFNPQFPIELIEKDFGYLLEAVGDASLAPIMTTAQKVFYQAGEAGMAGMNFNSVIKLFEK